MYLLVSLININWSKFARMTEATDLGLPVARLHDTYSHSIKSKQQADRKTQHATAREGSVGTMRLV